jgi:multicomponent Na+:H+ antiporter subunit F
MTGTIFLGHATTLALALLLIAAFVTVIRLLRGPTLPDRVLALDLLTTLGIAIIGVFAVRTGFMLYLDIAIALGLVGFLATVAFARYILSQATAKNGEESR